MLGRALCMYSRKAQVHTHTRTHCIWCCGCDGAPAAFPLARCARATATFAWQAFASSVQRAATAHPRPLPPPCARGRVTQGGGAVRGRHHRCATAPRKLGTTPCRGAPPAPKPCVRQVGGVGCPAGRRGVLGNARRGTTALLHPQAPARNGVGVSGSTVGLVPPCRRSARWGTTPRQRRVTRR